MTIGSIGRSLELFFIDGKPEGMQTAELFNWTGHVLMAPRTRMPVSIWSLAWSRAAFSRSISRLR